VGMRKGKVVAGFLGSWHGRKGARTRQSAAKEEFLMQGPTFKIKRGRWYGARYNLDLGCTPDIVIAGMKKRVCRGKSG